MPTTLDQALTELKNLPADAQEAVIRDFLELIRSEAKWDRLFADPRSEKALHELAAEADAEDARGEIYNFDPATRPDRDHPQ